MLMTVWAAGCATQNDIVPDALQAYEVTTALASGQIRFSCELACSASWMANKKKAHGLYRHQVWGDLAVELVRVGYSSDLTYFYLGRAAEGLDKRTAAAMYYRLALAAESKCNGLVLNQCDGLDVGAQAKAGLTRTSGG